MRFFKAIRQWWETRQEEKATAKAAADKAKREAADLEKRAKDRAAWSSKLSKMSPAQQAEAIAERRWKSLRADFLADRFTCQRERRASQGRMDRARNDLESAKRKVWTEAANERWQLATVNKFRQTGMTTATTPEAFDALP